MATGVSGHAARGSSDFPGAAHSEWAWLATRVVQAAVPAHAAEGSLVFSNDERHARGWHFSSRPGMSASIVPFVIDRTLVDAWDDLIASDDVVVRNRPADSTVPDPNGATSILAIPLSTGGQDFTLVLRRSEEDEPFSLSEAVAAQDAIHKIVADAVASRARARGGAGFGHPAHTSFPPLESRLLGEETSYGAARVVAEWFLAQTASIGAAIYLRDLSLDAASSHPESPSDPLLSLVAVAGSPSFIAPPWNDPNATGRVFQAHGTQIRLLSDTPTPAFSPLRDGTSLAVVPLPGPVGPVGAVLVHYARTISAAMIESQAPMARMAGHMIQALLLRERVRLDQQFMDAVRIRQELAAGSVAGLLDAPTIREGLDTLGQGIVPGLADALLLYVVEPPPDIVPGSDDLGPISRIYSRWSRNHRDADAFRIQRRVDEFTRDVFTGPDGRPNTKLTPDDVNRLIAPFGSRMDLANWIGPTEPLQTIICQALVARGEVVGLLALVRFGSARRRIPHDASAARSLAALVGAAISAYRSWLKTEYEQALDEILWDRNHLGLLQAFASRVTRARTENDVFDAIVDAVTTHLSDICIVDEMIDGRLVRTRLANPRSAPLPPPHIWRELAVDAFGARGAAAVARTGHADYDPGLDLSRGGAERDPGAPGEPSAARWSYLCLPIIGPGGTEIRAVITCIETVHGRVSLTDVALMEDIAALVPLALGHVTAPLPKVDARPASRSVDAVETGVAHVDAGGICIASNDFMDRLYGRSITGLHVEDLHNVIVPRRWDGHELSPNDLPIAACFQTGQITEGRLAYTSPTGEEWYTVVTAVPYLSDDDTVEGALIVARNVTADYLAMRQWQLDAMVSLGDLHETMREVDVALADVDLPDAHSTLHQQISVLRARLHAFERTVNAAFPPLARRPRRLDLLDVLRTVARRFERMYPRGTVTLEAPDMAIHGDWDARTLERVLVIMLTVVRRSPSGNGHVAVVVEPQVPDRVRVHVANPGHRVSNAEVAFVVRPYYRATIGQAAGTQDDPGSDLSIARQLAQDLGGMIHLSGTPGGATDLTLDLPITLDAGAGFHDIS